MYAFRRQNVRFPLASPTPKAGTLEKHATMSALFSSCQRTVVGNHVYKMRLAEAMRRPLPQAQLLQPHPCLENKQGPESRRVCQNGLVPFDDPLSQGIQP